MSRLVNGFLMCALMASTAIADDASKKDVKGLQGNWQAVEVRSRGQKFPPNQVKKFRIVIKGNVITFNPDGGDRKSQFKLDLSKSPKAIDLTPLDGPQKGKIIPGIYSLEKGVFKICISNSGKDLTTRPTKFKTSMKDGLGLLIFNRAKPK